MKEYSYNIINDVYNWMLSRKKDIEVRVLNEKSQAIRIGDMITFNNQDNIGKFVKTKVINKTIIENINELFEKFDVERIMPGHSKEELVDLMQQIYGDELNQKQIVAFEFEYLFCNSNVEVIEYEDKYLDNVRNLLTELEEYIVSIDKDELDQVHPEYHEKMALIDLDEVNNNSGKCYLAIENNDVIGLIMGTIPPYDEYDYLDYKCPKRGIITELIVTSKTRSKGVGQALISKMEEYFKLNDCEYVLVDVFAYNENAIKFYGKNGYHPRMYIDIKKLK